MNCEKCKDTMVVRIYGVLTPEEEEALELHVSECPSCARAYARTHPIHNVFDVGDDIPEPEWEDSWRVIRDRSLRKTRRIAWRRPSSRRAWVAVAGVVVFAVGIAVVWPTWIADRSPDRPLSIQTKSESLGPMPTGEIRGQSSKLMMKACQNDLYSAYTDNIRTPSEQWNTEDYDRIYDNQFHKTIDTPYSTFSIDVDAASYSNVRRFINRGALPPTDAVRIEELINYFSYDYPDPEGTNPFSITTEVATCPWNDEHKLVHIGLQGRRVTLDDLPPNNLVFLLDVSGSMNSPNKLPLLKSAFKLLTEQLRDEDRVAIVVYAGAAGLVLPSTPGDEKATILDAIGALHAGGTTAGGAGIKLAYKIAEENYIDGGNNRVILATDGDFNTGVSSDAEMVRLIEEKRETGVFIAVLGFGEGNLKDAKMEKIADHGNGHYAYIDDIYEARKVLVNELGATLLTIAKDVKIQVEFNPARVESYRLIGYENRMLETEDFNDDKKDAGEIGASHSLTALYEVVPAVAGVPTDEEYKTKYTSKQIDPVAFETSEMLTVRFRYKEPDGDTSRLITRTLVDRDADFSKSSENFRFAAAVAEFGMLLRNSEFKSESSYAHVLNTAKNATGEDQGGYRHEFVRLVEKCQEIAGDTERE